MHFGHLVMLLAFLFFFSAGIYIVIYGISMLFAELQIKYFIIVISGVGTAMLFAFCLAYNMRNRVIFCDNKLIITGHWIIKNEGLQFPDEIEYSEIKDISIICANANSLKKRIKNAGYSSLRPFFFFEFLLKNGTTKWLYIECYSKQQRRKMLEIINSKNDLNLSYDDLETVDYSIYRRNKK